MEIALGIVMALALLAAVTYFVLRGGDELTRLMPNEGDAAHSFDYGEDSLADPRDGDF